MSLTRSPSSCLSGTPWGLWHRGLATSNEQYFLCGLYYGSRSVCEFFPQFGRITANAALGDKLWLRPSTPCEGRHEFHRPQAVREDLNPLHKVMTRFHA